VCFHLKEPILLVLAAGMGSRYGGMKQIDPVGKNGEIIIDYSLYDAVEAGFKKAVFVIKEENRESFENLLLPTVGKKMEIKFVYQKLENVPQGCAIPEGREKPWGTGHAVLSAIEELDAPFAVITADDFYGREAFEKIYNFLKDAEDDKIAHFAMVGFRLKNTVSDNGYVSRGVCETKNQMLTVVTERVRIEKRDGGIAYLDDDGKTWVDLPGDSIVSMSLWGFTASVMHNFQRDFEDFFKTDVPNNSLKAEFYLPAVVNDAIQNSEADVKVLYSSDKWYGVTHKEDKEQVVNAIAEMIKAGKYPSPLWG
jgi:dTDP-glucose pyrophosphorylase